LVAYVVTSEQAAPSVETWRAPLRSQLPEVMIPSRFVRLDALPRTPNGKVDRASLPVPDDPGDEGYAAPRDSVEAQVALIWAEVLQRDRVGIHDNFFELGGDSILSLEVVSRARQAGFNLTPRQVFQHQTVAELTALLAQSIEVPPAITDEELSAELVDAATGAAAKAACANYEDVYPLSPLQQGLLFHSLYAPASGVYIEQMSWRMAGELDVPAVPRGVAADRRSSPAVTDEVSVAGSVVADSDRAAGRRDCVARGGWTGRFTQRPGGPVQPIGGGGSADGFRLRTAALDADPVVPRRPGLLRRALDAPPHPHGRMVSADSVAGSLDGIPSLAARQRLRRSNLSCPIGITSFGSLDRIRPRPSDFGVRP
jgi:aryl carrier-like protein